MPASFHKVPNSHLFSPTLLPQLNAPHGGELMQIAQHSVAELTPTRKPRSPDAKSVAGSAVQLPGGAKSAQQAQRWAAERPELSRPRTAQGGCCRLGTPAACDATAYATACTARVVHAWPGAHSPFCVVMWKVPPEPLGGGGDELPAGGEPPAGGEGRGDVGGAGPRSGAGAGTLPPPPPEIVPDVRAAAAARAGTVSWHSAAIRPPLPLPATCHKCSCAAPSIASSAVPPALFHPGSPALGAAVQPEGALSQQRLRPSLGPKLKAPQPGRSWQALGVGQGGRANEK